ncbi:slime mold cyclic amp receptor protein [Pelomyxa schiedti]|nr:slime mold cyclic amp receptor protein [Pelomyxa schiedti]
MSSGWETTVPDGVVSWAVGLTLGSSLLSVVACACTFAWFLFGPEKKVALESYSDTARHHSGTKIIARLVFCLQISDFISSCSMSISASWLIISPSTYTSSVCLLLRTLIQLGVMSSFGWTTAIAVYIYRDTNHVSSDVSQSYDVKCWRCYCSKWRVHFTVMHVMIWGISAFLSVLLVSTDLVEEEPPGWCHPVWMYQWFTWYGPMILMFGVNLVLYFLVLRVINRVFAFFSTEGDALKKAVRPRLLLYSLIPIICWSSSIINHIQMSIAPTLNWYWLWLLGDLLAPLQGFFNCLVYSTTNDIIPWRPLAKCLLCWCCFSAAPKASTVVRGSINVSPEDTVMEAVQDDRPLLLFEDIAIIKNELGLPGAGCADNSGLDFDCGFISS